MTAARLEPLLQQIRTAARPDTDRQLLDAFLAKSDGAAFAALVRRHGPLVLAACRGVLRDSADVDDAFQATFVTLFRKADTVRDACVGGWLFRVARRIALEAGRAAERRRRREERAAPPALATPADLSWREACGILHEEIDRLPATYRLPLLLCGLEGLSRDEAARQLGWSLNEVRGRLERGRQALRVRLLKRGVGPAVGLLALLGAEADAMPPALLLATLRALTQPPAVVEALARTTTIGAWKAKLLAGALLAAGMIVAFGSAQTPAGPGPVPAPPANKSNPSPSDDAAKIAVIGRVLDAAGKPLAEVPIYTVSTDLHAMLKLDRPVATTDAIGKFRCSLADVKHDPRTLLLAWPTNCGPDWEAIFPDSPEQTLTLRPPVDDVPIRGRVVDLQGRPVAGAAVTLRGLEVPPDGLKVLAERLRADPERYLFRNWRYFYLDREVALRPGVSTDADGRFEMRGVGRGRIAVLRVSGAGLEQDELHVVMQPDLDVAALQQASRGQTQRKFFGPTFEFVANPDQPVQGVVRDKATGKPVAGVEVSGQVHLAKWIEVTAKTDSHGGYRLTGMGKSADRRVVVRPAPDTGYLPLGREITGAAGLQPVTADFALEPGVRAAGRVIDKGNNQPVAAWIYYVPLPENRFVEKYPELLGRHGTHAVHTTTDGRFAMVVPPGAGLFLAEVGTDMRTGLGRFRPAEVPDDAKHIKLQLLHSGEMTLVQTAYNAAHQFNTNCAYGVIDPPGDAKTISCQLECDPGHSLAAKFVGPDGESVTGVEAIGLSPFAWHTEPVRVPGPTVTIPALARHEVREILFRQPDRKLAGRLRLTGRELEPVDVKFAPWGSVSGRVLDENGKPLAGAQVRMWYPDRYGIYLNSEELNYFAKPVRTDADGRFRGEGLPPGAKVMLSAVSKNRRLYNPGDHNKKAWVVQPGATHDLGDVSVTLTPE